MSDVQVLMVDGEAMTPAQILAFAQEHPRLIGVKKEALQDFDGSFYSLNYTEEANSMPEKDWHPITMRCRGLVLFEPQEGELRFVIVPCPKFFNWPAGRQLPDTVTFRRKVDGSCIHAAAMAIPESPRELRWIVGTRSSIKSLQARAAAAMLPQACTQHLGLTLMMELIDPECDPHGETDAAAGPRGLRLLHAWQSQDKIPCTELQTLLPLLGNYASIVPQSTSPREEFLSRFEELECASTRDEIREGFVVEVDGLLLKYKSKTWLRWSKVPIVSERNILRYLRKSLATMKGDKRPRTRDDILDLVKKGFPHLTTGKSDRVLESEKCLLESEVQRLCELAEAQWRGGLCRVQEALTAVAGEENEPLERKVIYQVSEAKPYISTVMNGSRKAVTVVDFIGIAWENHTLADSLFLLVSKLQDV